MPNGRLGGRFNFENMFVERPAGGAVEVLVGGFDFGEDQESLRLLTEHLLATIGTLTLMLAQSGV